MKIGDVGWFAIIGFIVLGVIWVYGEYIRKPDPTFEVTIEVHSVVFQERVNGISSAKYIIVSTNGTQTRFWIHEDDADDIIIGHNNTIKYTENQVGRWVFEVIPK